MISCRIGLSCGVRWSGSTMTVEAGTLFDATVAAVGVCG